MKRTAFIFCCFIFIGNALFAQLPETVEWAPNIKMDKHIFPSYIIAGATVKFTEMGEHYIGEARGLMGIDISSTYRFAKFKLEIRADEIADPTIYEFTLPHDKRRDTFYVFPNINYRYLQLRKITQPVPVNVTFILYVDGKEDSRHTVTVSVHSINDCPFMVINPDKTPVDMKWMFGAYVNENHPMIDQILREALNTGLVDQFTDYQLASETNKSELFRQVIAVWTALYNRHLTYSNTVTPSLSPGNNIASQHIRFFDEAMNSAQANCVDGSVALASIFRKIGIEPYLVVIPGHCFMGFYGDPEKTEYYNIETTVIGSKIINERMVDSSFFAFCMNLYPPELAQKNKGAIMAFAYAVKRGELNYSQAKPNIAAGDTRYKFIDIDKSRKEFGVIPIAN